MTAPSDQDDDQAFGADGGVTADDDASLADQWGAALSEQGGDALTSNWASMISNSQDLENSDIGADRLLHQDEIDSLLGYTLHEEEISVAPGARAIADSGLVSHERLPMLEIVFDRMVRLLSASLRAFFSDNVEVTLDGITSVRFGDYLNSVPLPALLAVVKAEEWDNLALVTVETALSYSALDMLLGGRRATSGGKLDGRAYTTIETQLIRRLIEVTLGDAEAAFKPLSPVRFNIDRIETNPRFAMITRPANAAILIELRVDMEGRGGKLELLLPYATIEPIRDLLLQSFLGEKLSRDPVWEGHFATEIWQSKIKLEAVLHEMKMPLRRVLAMEVGDTVMFDRKPDSLVKLRCGETVLSEGRVGRIDDRIAIKVAKPLRRSRTTLSAFEAAGLRKKS